jgi:hypothetical protein
MRSDEGLKSFEDSGGSVTENQLPRISVSKPLCK